MIHVNPSQKQRRACDRCHQAKLKCLRDGNKRCRRCERTDSECIFSPPVRLRRQNSRSTPSTLPLSSLPTPFDDNATSIRMDTWPDVGIDVDLDFPMEPALLTAIAPDTGRHAANTSLPQYQNYQQNYSHNQGRQQGYDDLLTPIWSSAVSSSSTSAAFIPSATSHEESLTLGLSASSNQTACKPPTALSSLDEEAEIDQDLSTDMAFWTNKVAQLNVQFTQHLQTIPRPSPESLDSGEFKAMIPVPGGKHDPDRTFHLSESFVNILSSMCSKLPPSQRSMTAVDKDGLSAFLSLDEASYLIVFSTYLRFLETHDSVFRYLLACLAHKRESNPTGTCFFLPKLSLGSFSLARTSETRPLIFVTLMESMLTRVRTLFHRLSSVQSSSGENADQEGSSVIQPDLALRAVRAKEADIAMSLERIKSILSRLD